MREFGRLFGNLEILLDLGTFAPRASGSRQTSIQLAIRSQRKLAPLLSSPHQTLAGTRSFELKAHSSQGHAAGRQRACLQIRPSVSEDLLQAEHSLETCRQIKPSERTLLLLGPLSLSGVMQAMWNFTSCGQRRQQFAVSGRC